jgi:nucleoside-diphosphate-sugar epimerase
LTSSQALENNLFGYQASKTFSEKAAWDFISSRPTTKWPTLVTVCPPLIFGPVHPASGITLESPNESSAQLLKAANGADSAPTRMPVFADVRDVARTHVKALDTDKLPESDRFLVCGGKFTWAAIEEIARTRTHSAEAIAPAEEFYAINTGNVEEKLGIRWTSLDACVKDSLDSLGVKSKI